MTQQNTTSPPTNHPSHRNSRPTQHTHNTTAQASYQPSAKIKNCTTHPRITIRRMQEPPLTAGAS
jgi:hypothetical protein